MDGATTNTPSSTSFHPSVAAWFSREFDHPTAVQQASWPVIAGGAHCLITAPTGSGKTLTAFMWALSQFAEQQTLDRTRVLYISPLKALNNDIQRNLLAPLAQLEADFEYPKLRVQTRSGDTSQSDRQRMLRRPPDILITTPESLGLLLTTRKGRQALADVETVILDEIHALVDNRRGVSLLTNLERLADISGEFQRVALSATVSPLELIAEYIAGVDGEGQPRHVQVINPPSQKALQFRVRFPLAAKNAAEDGKKIWEPLSDSFRDVIEHNTSTLFFTNSRRLAEKITLKINREEVGPVAYAHHGSLARDVRTEVERRMKNGELKAIVATNSLEMGIDVGHLDEVVMVQSPPSVASTIQRIGRAGHRVGETSVGTLYPTHAHDFLEAAALGQAVHARDIEPQQVMRAPLDVLAQLIICICATDPWDVDEVYQLIIRSGPYRTLSRDHFDLVVDMLAGRYSGTRVRELKARLIYDRRVQTIQANRGALLAFYNSGGTIPDRGYYQMRHVDTGAILGELDEEFVWEATVGDTLTLGTRHWQIHKITHNDVVVRAAKASNGAPPFWRAEFFNRSFHFSQRIGEYLSHAEQHLSQREDLLLRDELTEQLGFEDHAADELIEYFGKQRAHTETALPHRKHLLLELVKSGPAGYRGPDDPQQLVIHTFWGGQLNQPWALALQAAWQQRHGAKLEVHCDNNAVVLQCKGELNPHDILHLVSVDNLTPLLRQSLESSGFFGARFRECAGRALLLNKQRFNQRLPLWMSRLQAKKLMTQVKTLSDFPVLLETWRTCMDDEFDLPGLQQVLTELAGGEITWSFVSCPTPSPFAHNLTFGQVSRYMYADDTPEDDGLSQLSDQLIEHALYNDALRPSIDPAVVQEFVNKRQRLAPGYEPTSAEEWGEWLKERVLIADVELAHHRESAAAEGYPLTLGERTWWTHPELVYGLYQSGLLPGAAPNDAVDVGDTRSARQYAEEVLSFYGPLQTSEIEQLLPSVPDGLLTDSEQLISGQLISSDASHYWCDAQNYEILMRMQRAAQRVSFEALPFTQLPAFWAWLARLDQPADEPNELYALELLRGYGAPVENWLYDFLPVRLQNFRDSQWHELLERYGMAWRGTGAQAITFTYPEELYLFTTTDQAAPFTEGFSDPHARYTYTQLVDTCGTTSGALNESWWQAVWQGQLSSDSITPLQQGVQRKFTLSPAATPLSHRRRLRNQSNSWSGNWFLLHDDEPKDPLTLLEADKERVRLLLDRYGLINRDIVLREKLPTTRSEGYWRWRDAFRALRVMELAGEVQAGQFFTELSTPQFALPRTVSALLGNSFRERPQKTFWINAMDPVAPVGLGLPWQDLPARRGNNYMVFDDGSLALIVENLGKTLTYCRAPDDPALDAIHAVFNHLVEQRRLRINIRQINGEPAKLSPYLEALRRVFRIAADHKSITLEPSY